MNHENFSHENSLHKNKFMKQIFLSYVGDDAVQAHTSKPVLVQF